MHCTGTGVRAPLVLEGVFLAPVLLPAHVQLAVSDGSSSEHGASGAAGACPVPGAQTKEPEAEQLHRVNFIVKLVKGSKDVIRGSFSCGVAPKEEVQ